MENTGGANIYKRSSLYFIALKKKNLNQEYEWFKIEKREKELTSQRLSRFLGGWIGNCISVWDSHRFTSL